MAKLPEYKRLVVEDYPEQAEWIERLLVPLNRFMLSVYQAFNKGIDINDNVLGQLVVNQTVSTTTFPLKFRYSLYDKFGTAAPQPRAVIIGKISEKSSNPSVITSATTVDWSYANGTISINNITGLTPGVNYLVNFVILSN